MLSGTAVRVARPLLVALVLTVAVALVQATFAGPAAAQVPPTVDPMVIRFTADAGEYPYVLFGQSVADAGETVCVKVDWGYTVDVVGTPERVVSYLTASGLYRGFLVDEAYVGGPGLVPTGNKVAFPEAGTYDVTISPLTTADDPDNGCNTGPWLTLYGSYRRGIDAYDPSFFNGAAALTGVQDFGDLGITSLSEAFSGQPITDVPTSIPASIRDLTGTFRETSNFNDADIASWDVSNITGMRYLFDDATAFNQPLANWERAGSTVANVTEMSNMFEDAILFDQPLGSWNVSGVTDMDDMFEDAIAFNNGGSDDIGAWNVSNVTSMDNMFEGASVFNQPIGSWNVARVTDMGDMFKEADAFNQPIGTWDVSSVTDMNDMFEDATAFDQPIGSWNVSSVNYMNSMFSGAIRFDQPIGSWDVSSVIYMHEMFLGATAFDQPIGNWNVANVEDMEAMFAGAEAFNQPIGSWDVSSVTNMSSMFSGAIAFDQPLGFWNVANVQGMDSMFEGATAFDQPIGDWDVSGVNAMGSMFTGAASFDRSLGDWVLGEFVNLGLNGSGMSSSCYDATLVGLALDPSRPWARISAGGIEYSPVGAVARASLVDRSWEITGDTEVAVATGRCAEEAASSSSGGATLTLTCTPTDAPVGATVTCEVGGGDPDIDILWRTAVGDGQVASGAVRLGPDGTGTFRFVVPRSAAGRTLDVELVEWTGPIPIGVAGGPVPGSVPAGEGPGTGGVLPLAVSGLLLLVVAGAHRTGRRRALARP